MMDPLVVPAPVLLALSSLRNLKDTAKGASTEMLPDLRCVAARCSVAFCGMIGAFFLNMGFHK